MELKTETKTTIYQQMSKEELIQMVEELREEARIGSVFSSFAESGANDATLMWQGRNRFLAENVQPVSIKPVPDKSFPLNVGGRHRIIDGDNLAVMRSLLTDFRGGERSGFDVIYIDPPYNTGKDIFAYNDSYRFSKSELAKIRTTVHRVERAVLLDDPSRHTKWINHIAPRLFAARKLLKNTGVIIISIDEHELPRLWMLLEEMYQERNRIATLIWERSRKNDPSYVSEGHEYILIWAKDKSALDAKIKRLAESEEGQKTKGKWRKRKDGVDEILAAYAAAKLRHQDDLQGIQDEMKQFFKGLPKDHPARKIRYRHVDEFGMFNNDGDLGWPSGTGPTYDVIHPVTQLPCAVPKSGWRFTDPADMEKLIAEGKVVFKKDHTLVPRRKVYLHEMEHEVALSVIRKMGQRGVETVEQVLGKGKFKSPKDHELLAELFNLVTWRDPKALILDPYAGSGTTGHAVLEMNAIDNGQRQFVLIENGDPTNKVVDRDEYTDTLTAERVRRVLSGKWADGKQRVELSDGFTFYEAKKTVGKKVIMESNRESLADIILQIVEEDSNRIDCRVEGYKYLIGRTKLGYGIALVWEPGRANGHQPLTREIRSKIIEEARAANVTLPVYIYAVANVSPENDSLYRFQQIPDSILYRLNLLNEEDEE
ncbi:site-specific DNA-methyltransferase [Deinococcus sp. 14RED07]|uniref:site-specific DNA-methyltransferase n=1 Tax=Deinococcus sp. 14RED07 TaxID=2745874 RepID=UPI001E3015E2|nr:site-specific DNA-methyltransferase [Deinococcus sp. 14RED07]MCD0175521.1 site-specific DNA-methyltransferase [Deinococcus sp. 14RED07]